MGDKVGRSTLFGIPLQQTVGLREHRRLRADVLPAERRAALLLLVHRRLHRDAVPVAHARSEQARFDPMITGFNPADMYARRSHQARAARRSPASSRASASSRSTRNSSRRRSRARPRACSNPALDRILDFAGRDRPRRASFTTTSTCRSRSRAQEPVSDRAAVRRCCKRHPKTTIIWAHVGLGRIVRPVQGPARPCMERRGCDQPGAEPRLRRHLVGRSRQVRRRDAGVDQPRWPTSSTGIRIDSCSAPTRWRRPTRPNYLQGVRHVRAAVRAADAGGEPEGAEGQLRAALRRGAAAWCARGKRRTCT